jgi:glycine/D-amino acid oxidase-like deaminating enzyme
MSIVPLFSLRPKALFRLITKQGFPHRIVVRSKAHPWGTPPWTVDFRPAKRPLPDQVDFAIVGAGFAGLSAAVWLAKLAPNKSIVVLESEMIGNGASGRTGGMALADTAAGPLPGLGDVLAGYKKILAALHIDARLTLPGAWELGRSHALKNSPISWNDSGNVRVVKKVPGGTVNPGKVVSGLARAAQKSGAQIIEHAEVVSIDPASQFAAATDSDHPLALRIRLKSPRGARQKTIHARQVLLTTNAASLHLTGLHNQAEPKLTLALATAPLTRAQLQATGLAAGHPFYTIDFPYLWGRPLENHGYIFGAGLVPMPKSWDAIFSRNFTKRKPQHTFSELFRFHTDRGITAKRLDWLESRVRNMHPALQNIRVTHRWGGPILITKGMHPIFRHHAHHKNILTLAGFSGHGVALSVYLGHWAAQSLLGHRPLPHWPR